ncbi:MAG: hypothetical protein JNK82_17340 [Myxococcaceae bacterium]|nr:hypothetical protein [Myxococcaceae bacterium]
MTPKELRAAMKAQKKALKAQLDANPFVQEARRKRRIRRAVVSAAALLLLLFVRCDCGEGPVIEPAVPDAGVVRDAGVKVAAKVLKRPPLPGKVEPQPRPDLGPQAPPSPSWLDEFRMQVAARSPRLAECFTGIENAGAIRWSTSVNPNGGTVSDHELSPTGVGVDLTKEQRTCILEVLSKPVYQLKVPGNEGLPNRVSLVIEF